MIRVIKPTSKRESLEIRSKWFSFYPKWDNLAYLIGPASYFDNRLYINISGIPLLTILLSPLIIWAGHWWLFIGLVVPWGKWYIHLPIYSKIDDAEYPQYGFYLYSWDSKGAAFNELVICRGYKSKFIHMPWRLDWVRTSNLKKDGTWEHETPGNSKDFWDNKWKDILWSKSYPYTYVLKSGKVQERTATLRVEEREWRPIWFKWTKLFRRVRKTINIDFSDEVGERTGSWKGGTTGCSYEMKHGELPVQTLRRMEKERKFT
jgi:hypothetical protein